MSKLSEWRQGAGLTLAEVAAKLGRSVSTVHRIEAGTRIPDRETMPKIVAMTAGEVKPEHFFPAPQDAPTPAAV